MSRIATFRLLERAEGQMTRIRRGAWREKGKYARQNVNMIRLVPAVIDDSRREKMGVKERRAWAG